MAYTPQTWNDGEAGGTPLSAARLTNMEDGIDDAHDLYDLGVGASDGAFIGTAETTAATSPGDLSTAGPTITVDVTSAGLVLVLFGSSLSNDTAGQEARMGVALSGGNTVSASKPQSIGFESDSVNQEARLFGAEMYTGLTAGSTTFTAKYWASGGTARFQYRHLVVIPF